MRGYAKMCVYIFVLTFVSALHCSTDSYPRNLTLRGLTLTSECTIFDPWRSVVVERMVLLYKEYYCVRIRVTWRARVAVCNAAHGMNAHRAYERWGVCDAQGKFRPIHSDDWKETGQENQMLVATSLRSIHWNPLLHLNAPTLRALCAYSTDVNRKHLRHFSNEKLFLFERTIRNVRRDTRILGRSE